MTTEQLILEYYQCFNRNDISSFINLLADDVIHDINQGGRQIGKSEFFQFMQHMQECYQERVRELVVMVSDDGKRAAAEFVIEGTYLTSDAGLPPARHQSYKLPCGAFFAVENGKISRVTNYYNLQDWLQQVQ